MPRHEHRASFLGRRRNDDVEDRVQGGDEPVDRAAAGAIDHRETVHHKNISGRHHIGTAEERDHVAIGVGRRLIQQLDRLAVQIQLLLLIKKRIAGPQPAVERLFFAKGPAHAKQHVLVRVHDRVAASPARGSSTDEPSGGRERLIAADVIRMDVRVDDGANRLVGNRFDGRNDLVAGAGQTGIDQQGTLLADLHRDVAAGAEDRIHVILHAQDFECPRRWRKRRRARWRRRRAL